MSKELPESELHRRCFGLSLYTKAMAEVGLKPICYGVSEQVVGFAEYEKRQGQDVIRSCCLGMSYFPESRSMASKSLPSCQGIGIVTVDKEDFTEYEEVDPNDNNRQGSKVESSPKNSSDLPSSSSSSVDYSSSKTPRKSNAAQPEGVDFNQRLGEIFSKNMEAMSKVLRGESSLVSTKDVASRTKEMAGANFDSLFRGFQKVTAAAEELLDRLRGSWSDKKD
uniref:Uncharacterized protein n=1 Tax=Polytomella parva TaxID=51329 RepID=A0A7S0V5Y8_9CHLO|mmetsp:Transcript_31179/g.56608  ORF Transcript_31179/g.56608 Transcript_31179/m.56608 type:complete len:223 (+) Transcript_31179:58-726(+)